MTRLAALVLLWRVCSVLSALPCGEIHQDLVVPCRCDVAPSTVVPQGIGVLMDCDHVVFPQSLPQLPRNAPIIGFSQRFVGHQSLPSGVFGRQELPLVKLDFSHNMLRRLPDRVFSEVNKYLEDLYLNDNLFGDNLNPIFASPELHSLTNLKVLDLSGNQIRGLEEGIFRGCAQLQELRLDRNLLSSVPSTSLRGPHTLRTLSLNNNRIHTLRRDAFIAQVALERVYLSNNDMSALEGGALSGLTKLRELSLRRNLLARFNSDVFQGIENVEKLDLSQNLLTKVPVEAIKVLPHLKMLNMSSNQIRSVGQSLGSHPYLDTLDLSRNKIAAIEPGTFYTLKRLRRLDLSVNSLRTIEDDAFEGLENLEELSLEDNNILLIPSSAVGRLPRLSILNLSYNRISALSPDMLRSLASSLISLNLARNVIRELQDGTFHHLTALKLLDLSGNLLTRIDGDTFMGLEETLESLNLADNKLATLAGAPLQLSVLKLLDLSRNDLSDLPSSAIVALPNLRYFNISQNERLEAVPRGLLHAAPFLTSLDMSRVGLKNIHPDYFAASYNMKLLQLSGNSIQNISDTTFRSLGNLTYLDLTDNRISNIRIGSFASLTNLKVLLLDGNKLKAFKGEFFKISKDPSNRLTSLEILSVSNNQLNYLFPSTLKAHPKLRYFSAHHNNISQLTEQLVSELQYIEKIDFSFNKLKAVEDMDFSRLPRLRELILEGNLIEAVSESAFHNSTQLQQINLANNQITRLLDRTFEGLLRIQQLQLQNNDLTYLPETIFDRSKVQILENINLAGNSFKIAPLQALQRQYFFLSSTNLSYNLIEQISPESPEELFLVNIKKLDLSYNPLTSGSVATLLQEPKTVRELWLAGVNLTTVTQLEMPFLKLLDLSDNNLSHLSSSVFQRSTMLESFNISHNKITNLKDIQVWKHLQNLQTLDLSLNPIEEIVNGDFDRLSSLKVLNLNDLELVMKIEKNAFEFLGNLSALRLYGYPRLGYIDVRGILQHLPALELLHIELKDQTVSSDELTHVMHPRLNYLGLQGQNIYTISTGVFAGLKAPSITLKIVNTSVSSLPQGLFFPLPRSSRISLDITNSEINTLSPQFLTMFDDHRKHLDLIGLETNPIVCDCTARALKKWLNSRPHIHAICHGDWFTGQTLNKIDESELSCDESRLISTTSTQPPSSSTSTRSQNHRKSTTESDIIWTLAPKKKTTAKPPKLITSANNQPVNNDDMLIISIVGGVVAFIVILVIVICIIRLRMVNVPYRGGPLAAPVPMPYPAAPAPSLYMTPSYPTLPYKHDTLRPPSQLQSHYSNSQIAYYVPYQPDEKIEYR